MSCPACGHDNRDGAKFCEECGARFARSCASCGSDLRSGAKFCDECGTPVARGQAAAPDRAPRDYTPKHLADKILRSKSALEGERKQVTVLFADVKGSLELCEQVDPEEWHAILDRFFQILADGVHRFEGTVNQYTGDGIMALFGAPIAHEDHAQRACYAALHLARGIRSCANELRLSRGLNFSVRMGLNSGEVVVGKIGDDLRMDYTAQGHTVGLAARMEQIAEPGKLYLAQGTAALVRGYFELEDLGELRVKGTEEPIPVYELKGPGALRTRFDVSCARGLARFVGRNDEMQILTSALARAREGNGQVVGVVAEAGIGKTRLCYEFVERCRAQGLAVLEGHALAHGKNVPLLPMLQVFRAYYGIEEQDSDRAAREKIAGRMLLIDEGFRELLPLLFEFFGVPDPERPAPRMDPEARQRQLFGVLRRILQTGDPQTPGVTLIEDLHWMDAPSGAFLEQWVEAIAGTRGLLVVNFRPEYHAGWMQKSYYHQLPLSPLGPQAIRDLLDDLLGSDASLGNLAAAIHERTAGNPFFTEEVVQSLIEAGSLEGTRGHYQLRTPIDELRVPDTVQSLLAARIDRLGEREKQLLQTAAVIGKEFAEPVLEGAAELAGAELADALAVLKGAEFIYERALYPVAEYAFKHPLTQEVALGSQLEERRRRIHGAVARAIEAAHAERLDEQAALLAHHWEEAGEAFPAARWHRRAGEWAGLTNPAQAIRHWTRVRSLVAELPESGQAQGLGVMACSQTLRLGYHVGLSEEDAAAIFSEGRALAERSGDPRLVATLLGVYAPVRGSVFGDVEGWVRYGCDAFEVASRTGDAGVELGASIVAQTCLWASGRLRESLKVADRMLATRSLSDADERMDIWGFSPYLYAMGCRGATLAFLGHLTEATHEIEKTIELARQRGEPQLLEIVHEWRVWAAEFRGEPDAALAHAQRAVELAEKLGVPFDRSLAYLTLGQARSLRGEWGDAASALELAHASIRESRTGLYLEPAVLAYLADAVGHGGDAKRAWDTAEKAVAVAQERRIVIYEIPAQVIRGRVLLRTDGTSAREEIEAALGRALTLIDETGARAYRPPALEERAHLAQLLGDDASRERELREAHRLYTEMGATGHAERLAGELSP